MDDLIEALNIFRKYSDTSYPTACEHDELRVLVDPEMVSSEDKTALEELGFFETEGCFLSLRFGG